MILDINARPFYPSSIENSLWKNELNNQEMNQNMNDFDNDLKSPTDLMFHLMTPQELGEIETMEEMNELLAELDVLEHEQELYHHLVNKSHGLRLYNRHFNRQDGSDHSSNNKKTDRNSKMNENKFNKIPYNVHVGRKWLKSNHCLHQP